MPEQMSLFDSLILQAANIPVKNTTSTKAEAPVEVKSKKTESSTPTKLTPPQKIVDLLDGVHTVEDLSVKCNVPFSHAVHGNVIYSDVDLEVQSKYSRSLNSYYGTTKVYQRNVVQIGPSNSNYYHREEDTVNLLYVDEDCNPWTAKIELSADGIPLTCHIEKKKWQLATRLQVYSPMQSFEHIRSIMQEKMPYTVKFCDEVDGDLLTFLIAPQLEHLDKAGYLFARSFFKACSLTDGLTAYQRYQKTHQDELDKFNRLIVRTVTPGKIKNVFKTSAEVAKVLKDERRIDVWDTYRILDKFGRIKQDDIQQAYDAGLTPGDLRLVNSILNKRYNNKPIFSFGSLMNYLGRIDMYEAIDKREGLQILSDYLSMCSQLGVEPKVDGDSLKREHDVMARNLRNRKDEIMEEKMKVGCEYLKKYDYAEDVFFVRGIRNHADLLSEANMQHNCVASYANSIVNRRSMIYVMRERAHPDKSLVTIELSPDGMQIRQKFMAHNRPIHNKSISDFIDRWHEHVKAVNKGIEQPMYVEYGQIEESANEPENDIEL